jgi:hypothetical protein
MIMRERERKRMRPIPPAKQADKPQARKIFNRVVPPAIRVLARRISILQRQKMIVAAAKTVKYAVQRSRETQA